MYSFGAYIVESEISKRNSETKQYVEVPLGTTTTLMLETTKLENIWWQGVINNYNNNLSIRRVFGSYLETTSISEFGTEYHAVKSTTYSHYTLHQVGKYR